jgi:hypothetical protein
VLPARRKILHFAKKEPAWERFCIRLKSGLAPTLLIYWPSAKGGPPTTACETALLLPDRRGRAKNAPEVRYASLVHRGGGQLLSAAAAGVGNVAA